jgi:hypothetical protein
MPTGGQSLVMSGNEIFEQEVIPKKSNKQAKDKETQQKSLKQKGTLNIPNLKTDKTSTPNNVKDSKIIDKGDKKPKVPTISMTQETENNSQRNPLIFLTIQILLLLIRNLS